MLSHQKVGQGEVPIGDGNILAARGLQLHLFPLKPERRIPSLKEKILLGISIGNTMAQI